MRPTERIRGDGPVCCPSKSLRHQSDHEPVVALAADRLDRRCADSTLHGDHLVQAALGLDLLILALGVREGAGADNVVGDDQASRPGAIQGPGEIARAVLLVRVDESEVKGADPFGVQSRQ